MPSSLHYHITKMVDWIVKINPTSVLDIGVGYGKWGFLTREYTDICGHNYDPETWQVRIDGVEAFSEYESPIYKYIYNKIYYGDIHKILPTLPHYDLVIMGDVIEHFDKEDGLKLLDQIKRKTRYILISSPTIFYKQELFNNPFECHRSFWTVNDFVSFDFDYDEFEQGFVALLRGAMADPKDLKLNGWPARIIYSNKCLKKRITLAYLLKRLLMRFYS